MHQTEMPTNVQRFISLLVQSGILKRGKFRLKSGRESDYFIDFGTLETASSLRELGACYAQKIHDDVGVDTFDVVFGPAYKGIPLALATVLALHEGYGIVKGYCFNRKEEKDHGEGGLLIGRQPATGERVLIVDDVMTDGATKLEMLHLLRATTAATVVGVLVGVDRSEPGTVEAFEKEAGVKVYAITTAEQLQRAASGW